MKKEYFLYCIPFALFSYSPFMGNFFSGELIRLPLIFSSIFILLIYSKVHNDKSNIGLIYLALSIFIICIFINIGDMEGLRSSVGLLIVFGFAITIRKAIQRESFYKIYIKLHSSFIYFLAYLSILSLLFYYLFGFQDLFSMRSNYGAIEVTPFGFVLEKDIVLFTLTRSFNYFVEPVYAAYFFYIKTRKCSHTRSIRSNFHRST